MPHRLLDPLLELGSISYLFAQNPAVPLSGWEVTPANFFYVIGGVLVAGFYGGRIWRDFLSTKAKSQSDYQDIKEIKDAVVGILRRLDNDKSDIEKDLLKRRADVDRQLSHLEWELNVVNGRLKIYDSRERKNLRKLQELETRMRPWLKEFEPDGTRSAAAVFAQIDAEEDTGNGETGS